MAPHLWLRAETKPLERRAHLTPDKCRELVDAGFRITVESSHQRIFPNEAYESIPGVDVVPADVTWDRFAPKDAFVLGLKELLLSDTPIFHCHVYFAHAYKNQVGSKEVLQRFHKGGGGILDVEYMTNENGQRVVAEFSPIAGLTGMAVGVAAWCYQQLGYSMPSIHSYDNEGVMVEHVKALLQEAAEKKGVCRVFPRIIVLGALGRSGRGALDMARKLQIPESHTTRWDLDETKGGGPFRDILDHDVFFNCILLTQKIPPFLTKELLDSDDRNLSLVVDISCDVSSPYNPLPFNVTCTTPNKPVRRVQLSNSTKPLEVMAIDFLPSLLPRESSTRFANKITPFLKTLPQMDADPVWLRAKQLFEQKVEELEASRQLQAGGWTYSNPV